MTVGRFAAFLFLMGLSVFTLLYLGLRIFQATPTPPSFRLCYSMGAVAALGWLGYFGGRA